MIIKSQQIGYARMYFCNVLYPKPYYELKESKEFIWRLKRFICNFFFFLKFILLLFWTRMLVSV